MSMSIYYKYWEMWIYNALVEMIMRALLKFKKMVTKIGN